jgi:hypothetical protein
VPNCRHQGNGSFKALEAFGPAISRKRLVKICLRADLCACEDIQLLKSVEKKFWREEYENALGALAINDDGLASETIR